MRIKLITPPVYNEVTQQVTPGALPILTAVLREKGHYVEQDDLLIKVKYFNKVYDGLNLDKFDGKCFGHFFYNIKNNKHKEFNKVLERILDLTNYQDFDLIGFDAHSHFQLMSALALAKKMKEKVNTPIVIGGYYMGSINPQGYNNLNFVDFMVIGGGELALLKLVDYLQKKAKLKDVPGLVYRKNGKMCQNDIGNMPIEKVPMPDFNGIPFYLYDSPKNNGRAVPYQIARGCQNRCAFCDRPLQKYEPKSGKKVIREIETLYKMYNVRHFEFSDTTVNADPKLLGRICDGIIQKKMDITWRAFARIDKLDKTLVDKMKKSGCLALYFGIETGSNRMLRFIQKDVTRELAAKNLKMCHEGGINNRIYLIAGLPSETKEDLDATLSFIQENAPYLEKIKINLFKVRYSSFINKDPEKYGLKDIKVRDALQLIPFYHKDTKRGISKYTSYKALQLAYWHHIVKKRKPHLMLIPDAAIKIALKFQKEFVDRKYNRYFNYWHD
ncbi:MAG: radical SAM protein [Nanoarchaeota archaeon]|nr:radical SAM protein [Nanoarchaeota archaeon]